MADTTAPTSVPARATATPSGPQIVDSPAESVNPPPVDPAKLATATASEREGLRRELRDLRAEMREVEVAAAQVSRSTRHVRVTAPTVKVEIDVADHPGGAPVPPKENR